MYNVFCLYLLYSIFTSQGLSEHTRNNLENGFEYRNKRLLIFLLKVSLFTLALLPEVRKKQGI